MRLPFIDRIMTMTDMQDKLFGSSGALEALSRIDTDIKSTLSKYGNPPDRSLPADFDTLARAIVGQQVSRAAASSIWGKMEQAGMTSSSVICEMAAEDLRNLGLSLRKAEYIIGIAQEVQTGTLDFSLLNNMSGEEVHERLIQIRGVGSWTAENYRLFALADMDAWPSNDIALQEGMRRLKSLDERPGPKEMDILAEKWKPYRGAGALVLWHLYGIIVRKATLSDI